MSDKSSNRIAAAAVLLAILVLFLRYIVGPAFSHDIYKDVHDKDGLWCCNDGDCERAEYRETPAYIEFYSRRLGAWVKVSHEKVTYRPIPDDQPGRHGHWCGYKRTEGTAKAPIHGIDPRFGTYCAFVTPGDS